MTAAWRFRIERLPRAESFFSIAGAQDVSSCLWRRLIKCYRKTILVMKHQFHQNAICIAFQPDVETICVRSFAGRQVQKRDFCVHGHWPWSKIGLNHLPTLLSQVCLEMWLLPVTFLAMDAFPAPLADWLLGRPNLGQFENCGPRAGRRLRLIGWSGSAGTWTETMLDL